MRKFIAVIKKETILLLRDIAGLVVLFVMPVFLVIVVTLAQEETLSSIKETRIPILFADNDHGSIASMVEQGLQESDFFEVKKGFQLSLDSEQQIKDLVSTGEYQIGIVVPSGASQRALQRARELTKKSMGDPKLLQDYMKSDHDLAGVTVYFDPAIRDSYRNAVVSSMKRLVQGAEIRILTDTFFTYLRAEMERKIQDRVKKYKRDDINMEIPDFVFPWQPGNLVSINESFARKKEMGNIPTMIQNNVPGFALFAMFFIVIPFSGSLIIERSGGTVNRIKVLPVSSFTLLSGKITVYLAVCLIQLGLMIAVGTTVLPLLGITGLEIGFHYGALSLAAVTSAFAAIGFGMAVGTLAGSIAQASMFGSVMVVIMAVMGGLMIPVYLMPRVPG